MLSISLNFQMSANDAAGYIRFDLFWCWQHVLMDALKV
jgi:hypothetical protein